MIYNFKKIITGAIVGIWLLIFIIFGFNLAFAEGETATINLPCSGYPWCNITDIGGSTGLVNKLYNIGLAAVGAAALGAMIYGGIQYTVSAGNTSKQQDAMEWILGAVWGIVLLLGAYLLFYTINPAILKLEVPPLADVQLENKSAYSSSTAPLSECTPQLNLECTRMLDPNKEYSVTPHCEVTLRNNQPMANCCWKEKIGNNEVNNCSL